MPFIAFRTDTCPEVFDMIWAKKKKKNQLRKIIWFVCLKKWQIHKPFLNKSHLYQNMILIIYIFHKTYFRTSLDPREKEEYQNSPFFGINLGIDNHGGSVNVGDKVFAIKNNEKSSLMPCLLLFPLPILLMLIWKRKFFSWFEIRNKTLF